MGGDGVVAELKAPGHLRVGEALGNDSKHSDLPVREAMDGPLGSRGVRRRKCGYRPE
jgi:hypothetical protein